MTCMIIPPMGAYLISPLIPEAVGEDKDDGGHLAEPHQDPQPRYLDPHKSWRLHLKLQL